MCLTYPYYSVTLLLSTTIYYSTTVLALVALLLTSACLVLSDTMLLSMIMTPFNVTVHDSHRLRILFIMLAYDHDRRLFCPPPPLHPTLRPLPLLFLFPITLPYRKSSDPRSNLRVNPDPFIFPKSPTTPIPWLRDITSHKDTPCKRAAREHERTYTTNHTLIPRVCRKFCQTYEWMEINLSVFCVSLSVCTLRTP